MGFLIFFPKHYNDYHYHYSYLGFFKSIFFPIIIIISLAFFVRFFKAKTLLLLLLLIYDLSVVHNIL